MRATVQKMFTDPTRIKMTDPGHPETCNVCGYWNVFEPSRAQAVWEECRAAARGCVQNKQELAEVLIKVTEPFRAVRKESSPKDRSVARILRDGAERARAVASKTMAEVKRAIGL
jgi:tryptophanyl-tRNA synthetase